MAEGTNGRSEWALSGARWEAWTLHIGPFLSRIFQMRQETTAFFLPALWARPDEPTPWAWAATGW